MSELIGPNIKAVIFDWDDTLVGTIANKWAQHKHIARTYYNRNLLDEDLRQHWGKPLSQLVRLLYETDDVEQAISYIHSVNKGFPKMLFDHSVGVVERLRSTGRLVGLVTAHRREGIAYDFTSLGIPSVLFDYIQTEDDTEFHKPNPKVFDPTIAWLGRHSVFPYDAVYIGDGLHDREAAIGAGMHFIGVETGLVSVEQFQEAGSLAIRSLVELVPTK